MNTLWVGIDMAKTSFTAAAVWQTERITLGKFSNETTGFQALVSAVQTSQVSTGTAQAQWVVEPTGGYELSLTFILGLGTLFSPRRLES